MLEPGVGGRSSEGNPDAEAGGVPESPGPGSTVPAGQASDNDDSAITTSQGRLTVSLAQYRTQISVPGWICWSTWVFGSWAMRPEM
ncbi:hypothetical protein CYFUS_009684 [Cystobacter fuscus]|uniref:Uncharacterized protein n=1 Tax=Cystobacter fuscus TaxID=43 RepID=A0A250JL57_9BACT|nr:hypothetical protein CYFUS_009684 [Cystobacter fuscus]